MQRWADGGGSVAHSPNWRGPARQRCADRRASRSVRWGPTGAPTGPGTRREDHRRGRCRRPRTRSTAPTGHCAVWQRWREPEVPGPSATHGASAPQHYPRDWFDLGDHPYHAGTRGGATGGHRQRSTTAPARARQAAARCREADAVATSPAPRWSASARPRDAPEQIGSSRRKPGLAVTHSAPATGSIVWVIVWLSPGQKPRVAAGW
jgi:hypothetical protein